VRKAVIGRLRYVVVLAWTVGNLSECGHPHDWRDSVINHTKITGFDCALRFSYVSLGFEDNGEVNRIIYGFSILFYDVVSVEEVVYHRVITGRDVLVCKSTTTLMQSVVSV
jgi:hypothetical protein